MSVAALIVSLHYLFAHVKYLSYPHCPTIQYLFTAPKSSTGLPMPVHPCPLQVCQCLSTHVLSWSANACPPMSSPGLPMPVHPCPLPACQCLSTPTAHNCPCPVSSHVLPACQYLQCLCWLFVRTLTSLLVVLINW
jgi:hypothetical protein